MSEIRFSGEPENPGINNRGKSKKRHSSILKSPSRNALQDLDPNASDERDGIAACSQPKKKRRSSRRVSFANTYQVQEFLTMHQQHTEEGIYSDGQGVQPTSSEDLQQMAYIKSALTHSDEPKEPISMLGQVNPSTGHGHSINGLENLLSGPIKNSSQSQLLPETSTSSTSLGNIHPKTTPSFTIQPRESAIHLPMIDENYEIQTTADIGSAQDWLQTGSHENYRVSLMGPSYHCQLPYTESFNSSCPVSSTYDSSFQDISRSTEIDLDVTANLELTVCREQFLEVMSTAKCPLVGPDDPLMERGIQKKDSHTFLKSLMESSSNKIDNEPALDSHASKSDSKAFLRCFMDSDDVQDGSNNVSTCNSRRQHQQNPDDSVLAAPEFLKSFMKSSAQDDDFYPRRDAGFFLQTIKNDPAGEFRLNQTPTPPQDPPADTTRVFDLDEVSSGMDLTACVGASILLKDKNTIASEHPVLLTRSADNEKRAGSMSEGFKLKSVHAIPDNTLIFGDACTAAMEMTAVSSKTIFEGIPTVQRMHDPEDTRILDTDDDTARMELTTCSGLLKSLPVSVRSSSGENNHLAYKMETATRINSGVFPNPSSVNSISSKQDLPRKFGVRLDSSQHVAPFKSTIKCQSDKSPEETQELHLDCTAKMEFTTCLGSLNDHPMTANSQFKTTVAVSSGAGDKGVKSTSNGQDDRTQFFSSACMDITECLGMRVVSKQPGTKCAKAGLSQTVDKSNNQTIPASNIKKQVSSRTMEDRTQVFTSDNTAGMDMTACQGGIVGQPTGWDSTVGRLKTPASSMKERVSSHRLEDHTQASTSNNAAGMDMTACQEGIVSEGTVFDVKYLPGMDLGPIQLMSGRYPSDPTCFFAHDDAGGMEIIETGSRNKHQDAEADTSEPICASSCDKVGKMETSTCVGLMNSDDQKVTSSNGSTLNFHEQDRNLEMTTCAGGGIVDTGRPSLGKDSNRIQLAQAANSTRLFTDDETGQMEFTTCYDGGMNSPSTKSENVSLAGPDLNHSRIQRSILQLKGMPLFSRDVTGQMELTSNLEDLFEIGQVGGVVSEVPAETEMPPGGQEHVCGGQEGNSTAAVELSTCDMRSQPVRDQVVSLDHLTEQNFTQAESEASTLRSDTFTIEKTIDNSTTRPDSPDNPTQEKASSPTSDITQQEQATSLARFEEQGCTGRIGDDRDPAMVWAPGIEDEHPMWIQNTEDFTGEAALAAVMMMQAGKEPTVTNDILQLPTFANEPECQHSTVPLLSEVEELEVKKADVGVDGSLLCQEDVAPQAPLGDPGPVSMQDFLSFVTMNISRGRRSVLPCLPQNDRLQTLSDLLEDQLIMKPKKELYEWAVDHLSTSIERMQDAVGEREQRMSETNPAVVRQVLQVSPDQAVKLYADIESLHRACTKMSRNSFKDWRLKMVNKTHESLQETEREMTAILATLSSLLEDMQTNMKELETYDINLDKALSGLEQMDLPSDEQVQEFVNLRSDLGKRQTEIEQMQKMKEMLEQEAGHLSTEIEAFQQDIVNMRGRKMGLEDETTSPDGVMDVMRKVEGLTCLQVWKLRKRTDDRIVFTFLADTVVFTVRLGKTIGPTAGAAADADPALKCIDGLAIDANLAANVAVSAQLAHNLILASLDVQKLQKNNPTTATLKMLLQDVSWLVSLADSMAEEVDRINYRHFITLNGTSLTVEFSNLDPMVKFWVTFDLDLRTYPFGVIATHYKHRLGKLRETDVLEAMSNVKPGWTYLSRLVHHLDALMH